MKLALPAAGLILVALLGACTTTSTGADGEPRLVARPSDGGNVDRQALVEGEAGIAVDPDGCQNWIIDDGFEGYASRRRDPRSGLPVCSNRLRPGYIYNEFQTGGFPDWLI